MPDLYRYRQLLTAALVANALRPVPGFRAGVPAMVGGWLTSELAPHLLALTAADTAQHVSRRGLGPGVRPAAALAAASGLGLASMMRDSAAAGRQVDEGLVEALGTDYLHRLQETHTDVDLTTPWRQVALPFRRFDDEVEVHRDLRYSDAGRRGLLDLYRPRDATLREAPVLLQVHGGGWSVGDKEHQGVPLMLHLAARGWVCVAINYRLSPREAFPAHLVDVKRAIAWIREEVPAYGGDPAFLAVSGGSAGGHLASLAALTPGDPAYQPGFEDADTSVQAAAPHYGVYDFAGATGSGRAIQMRDLFLGPKILQRDPRRDLTPFEQASPLLRIRADAPPFFVVHGTRDTLVPVSQARDFVAALRAVSEAPVGYAELVGAHHAFDVFPSVRSAHVVRGVERFLRSTHDTWLRERAAKDTRSDRVAG